MGLFGSIRAVNQLMTITEQGRLQEVRRAVRNDREGPSRGTGRITEMGK